jgi:membrane protein YqaA with SNARE-associated domain
MSEPTSGTALDVRRVLIPFIMRFVASLVMICVVVALIGYVAREPATALSRRLVGAFGLWGMALGTLAADGAYFPVPPQFYMLLAVASGAPAVPVFVAICAGSLVAGYGGYLIAMRLSRLGWLSRVTRQHRQLLAHAFERYGYRSALIASMLPIPFSVLCYAAGLSRLPQSFIALLSLCRVPKLFGFFWLIRAGWTSWT